MPNLMSKHTRICLELQEDLSVVLALITSNHLDHFAGFTRLIVICDTKMHFMDFLNIKKCVLTHFLVNNARKY